MCMLLCACMYIYTHIEATWDDNARNLFKGACAFEAAIFGSLQHDGYIFIADSIAGYLYLAGFDYGWIRGWACMASLQKSPAILMRLQHYSGIVIAGSTAG